MPLPEIALIIDDDGFFADLLSEMFMQRKFMPVWCPTAEDALTHTERGEVAIVMSDIFMPGIGGIKGIQLLKSKFPNMKVFAMSGGSEGMNKEKSLKAASMIGADAVLMKPFTAEQLDALLEEHGIRNTESA